MNGNGKVQIDSLVEGLIGSTEKRDRMRVFRISPFGHVAGINGDGQQRLMHVGNFEVVEGPRPVVARTDIPARLR